MHQADGVREGRTAIIAVGLAAAIPVLLLCIWGQYRVMAKDRYRGLTAPTLLAPQSQPAKAMPEPRLEVTPGAGLAELRAAEDAELNSYGWIDRTNHIIRIPIERAMELLAQRRKTK
ncbi:MAG TPA: hypothetical protein VHB20_05235 [Verrucomicrobiae bacterium]|jgi:hypothetical protein|nr:hypothetical protein [Verrucomicrobiae bacterium]